MDFLKKIFSGFKTVPSCCAKIEKKSHGLRKIAIVGSPNVGKSVMFNRLTGSYVTVSNYPGTTVEVSRGATKIGEEEFEVVDTPGMYSLLPISEEERVARTLLREEKPEVVLHIVDAKNLERMLPLSLQLIEAKLPIILVLNIIDEAENLGMKIDVQGLEKELKVPVIATVSTTGRGIDILKGRIEAYARSKA
jgi:ferrous iron transport protein B